MISWRLNPCYTIGLSVRSDMSDKLCGRCCSIKLVLVAVLVMGGVRHHPDHTSCSLSATRQGQRTGKVMYFWTDLGPKGGRA